MFFWLLSFDNSPLFLEFVWRTPLLMKFQILCFVYLKISKSKNLMKIMIWFEYFSYFGDI